MKQKLLALVLCLAMMLTFLPTMSFAASAEEGQTHTFCIAPKRQYPTRYVYLFDMEIDTGIPVWDIPASSIPSDKWDYDGSTHTLNLYDGFDFETTGLAGMHLYNDDDEPFTINIEGNVKITGRDFGLFVQGKAIFTGNGTLTLENTSDAFFEEYNDDSRPAALYCLGGMTISEDVTIIAKGTSAGMDGSPLNITDNAKIIATGNRTAALSFIDEFANGTDISIKGSADYDSFKNLAEVESVAVDEAGLSGSNLYCEDYYTLVTGDKVAKSAILINIDNDDFTVPEPMEPVKYIDRTWDGEKVVETEKECAHYIVVDANTTTFENGKWYVVNADVTNGNRIVVNGTANLILTNGKKLTSRKGIAISEGNTLNVFGQSGDSGKLEVNGFFNVGDSAIGGSEVENGGTVAINGGVVTAYSEMTPAIRGTITLGAGILFRAGRSAEVITVAGDASNVESVNGERYFATTVAHEHSYDSNACTFCGASAFVVDEYDVLTKYLGNGGDVVIPEFVRKIGFSAFEGCTNLTSVQIPEFAYDIGESAFQGCTNLASVQIPECVFEIGKSAFEGCTKLTSVQIPECVDAIGDRAFAGCAGLTSVRISYGITIIPDSFLAECTNLTSVQIPESVEEIGKGAFAGCTGLTSIVIPESVEGIGSDTFSYCTNLTSVQISEGINMIDRTAFSYCTNLKSITIPASVTTFGPMAFYHSGLTEITVTDSIPVFIENNVFYYTNISTVNYPCDNDLEAIKAAYGGYVKSDANYNAIHGDSVQGDLVSEATCLNPAVYNVKCSECDTVFGTMEVGEVGDHIWLDATCTEPKTCSVCHVTEAEPLGHSWADATCTEPKTCSVCHVTEGEALGHTFENGVCTECRVEEFVIDESGRLTGYNGNGGDVVISEGVTSIGDNAFFACTGLTKVTIPEGVTSIGENAFGSCESLTEVTIPESVTSIGESAFAACSELQTVTISDHIQSVGEYAFGGADITTVNYPCGDDLDIIKAYFGFGVRFDATYNAIHDYSARGTLVSEATCEHPAVYEAKCKGCDLVQGTMDVGDALGHSWVDATCTEPKTCSVCHITEGIALGHTWQDANCTEPKTCSVCHITEGIAPGHTWVTGDLVSEATCLKPAVYNRECSVCHATDTTEVGEPLGHSFVFDNKGKAKCKRCSFTPPAVNITTNVDSEEISVGDIIKAGVVINPYENDYDAYMAVHVDGKFVGAFTPYKKYTAPTCLKCVSKSSVDQYGNFDIEFESACLCNAATCQAPATCIYCGATKGEIGTHNFVDGVCTTCDFTQFKFDSISLVLTGELGLNFYTTVNDIEAIKDGYMLFEIGNKGETQTVYFKDLAPESDGRYVFRCNVNALQMADTITVSFHYGDVTVGPKTISVASYIDKLIEKHNNDDNDPTVKLAKSIVNYGHYAQLAQTETRHFTLGEEYAVTDNLSDVTIANASDLEAYKATKTGSISEITKVTRSLSLDHGTDINLYLTMEGNYVPSVAVSDKNGNAVDFEFEKTDGRYRLVIPQIAAHELGDMYTVSIDSGAMTMNISALSHAYSTFTNTGTDTQKLFVSALYEYYMAAIAYQNAQQMS